MGILGMLSSAFARNDPNCSSCGAALDGELTVKGHWWCDSCGIAYKEVAGELVDLKDLRSSGPGGTCGACSSSLTGGDAYLPYEDGSNEYAYIRCPSCGHQNIREGFGE